MIYFMLCGLPGSGKSTLAWQLWENSQEPTVVLSTDEYIEEAARKQQKTYNEVFPSTIEAATLHMQTHKQKALACKVDIIHDQTNLTVKSRARKLQGIPSDYTKIAVICSADETERQKRLASRPGKEIPPSIDERMRLSWEPPTIEEGFDAVIYSP